VDWIDSGEVPQQKEDGELGPDRPFHGRTGTVPSNKLGGDKIDIIRNFCELLQSHLSLEMMMFVDLSKDKQEIFSTEYTN
jgi:hypothetical protein